MCPIHVVLLCWITTVYSRYQPTDSPRWWAHYTIAMAARKLVPGADLSLHRVPIEVTMALNPV